MLAFTALSAKQKQVVREDAEERYISHAFLHQSGAQHGNLKVDLRNDFITGSNRYPKTHQQTQEGVVNVWVHTPRHPFLCAPHMPFKELIYWQFQSNWQFQFILIACRPF
jgi:hypothetical protein